MELMKTVQITPFFFDFESDFVNTLKCVPMIVRYKLDSCGVKLKLEEWVKFSLKDKETLAFKPCFTPAEIKQYRIFVCDLVFEYTGCQAGMLSSVKDAWNELDKVPEEVNSKALEWGCPSVSLRNWKRLDTLQRFALVKLSRSGHEGKNFPRALKEFEIRTGLV